MNIYFDTEFTKLNKNGDLISLGLVSDTDNILYMTFNDYNKDHINEWLQENVIKNLELTEEIQRNLYQESAMVGGSFLSVTNITRNIGRKVLKGFIQDLYDRPENNKKPIVPVSDCAHFDFMYFYDLYCDNNLDIDSNILSPTGIDINQNIALSMDISIYKAFDLSREGMLFDSTLDKLGFGFNENNKHNALYDALVIRQLYHSNMVV